MNPLRNKLFRTGLLAAMLLLAGNPVADLLGYKYWTPRMGGNRMSVYAYQSTSEPFDVLFLGSSRTRTLALAGLAEDLLSRELGREVTAFNLAQPATNVLGFTIVLRDVVASNGCPEVIVYELTPGSLNAGTSGTTRVLEDYASLGDLAAMIGLVTDLEKLEAAGRGLLRGHANLALLLRRPPVAPRQRRRVARLISDRGARPSARVEARQLNEIAEDEEEEQRILELQASSSFADYRIVPAATDAVASAVAIADRCGADLVFVDPPVRPGYEESLDPDLPEFRDYLRELAATTSAGYHDLESSEIGLTEAAFTDRIHFTVSGAEKLTAHIATKILSPRLAERKHL